MNKLVVVTDTASDLTFEIAEKYNIALIPYQLQMGDNHYNDQVDISAEEFYATMENYDVLSTGIPSIQTVINKLEELQKEGYTQALLVCSSDRITGMEQLYQVVKDEYSDMDLYIVNSGQIASSTGLLAIYAAQLVQQKQTIDEVLSELDRVGQHINIFAVFRTLTYIIKGGRLNKYKGAIGNLLNINPILSEVNREVSIIKKVRGTKRSLQALIDQAKEELGQSKEYMIAIFHANNPEEVEEVKKQMADEISKAKLFLVSNLTPVLGSHSGPKAIGISTIRIDGIQ